MVNLTIDGRNVTVPERTTILDAAKQAGINIPTLCYLEGINEIGACRVCVVEVEGYEHLFTACNNTVSEGMVVYTQSRKAIKARRTNVELILSEHKTSCTYCARSGNCSLQRVANDLNIREIPFPMHVKKYNWKQTNPLIRDNEKCIKCMRCIQVCEKLQTVHVWDLINTGPQTTVDEVSRKCVYCGQCITHCPVGALSERDDTMRALRALHDPEKITVVQIAPSIRTAWGEPFGLSPDQATIKRLATALKTMGFDYVFDTDFSADMTIMEESAEFLERLKNRDKYSFPMFTSCCPGWVRYCKSFYPELLDNVSTTKSPQQIFGAVIKSYFAEHLGVDPKNIFSISLMPCLAKKSECDLPSMKDAEGDPDVDLVLTTREVDRLIRMRHIVPQDIPEEELDHPFEFGSGAGNIFGATGGVMEAALRTAYYKVTGNNPNPDSFKAIRGMKGWKEAEFDFNGTPLKVAAVNGLSNVRDLLEALKKGEVSYDFVEVMACPGGCVGGGGQPIHDGFEMAKERAPILYNQDSKMRIRFSHENPAVMKCYSDYFESPLSEKSEKLLHTDHNAWKIPGDPWS